MDSWKLNGVVALEKLILLKSMFSELNLRVYIRTPEVFAVPGPPTSSAFKCPGSFLRSCLITGRSAILSMMYSALVESPVGISN